MKKHKYTYSSLQYNLPKELGEKIIKWGKENITDSNLYIDPDDSSLGRENDIHLTILYGIHSDKSTEVRKLLQSNKSFDIHLGKVDIFDNNENYDVLMIKVKKTEELVNINKNIMNNVEATNNYLVYKPHITIAYVKKGKANKLKNNNYFENHTCKVDKLTFSSKAGFRETINFNEHLTNFKSFFNNFQFIT